MFTKGAFGIVRFIHGQPQKNWDGVTVKTLVGFEFLETYKPLAEEKGIGPKLKKIGEPIEATLTDLLDDDDFNITVIVVGLKGDPNGELCHDPCAMIYFASDREPYLVIGVNLKSADLNNFWRDGGRVYEIAERLNALLEEQPYLDLDEDDIDQDDIFNSLEQYGNR